MAKIIIVFFPPFPNSFSVYTVFIDYYSTELRLFDVHKCINRVCSTFSTPVFLCKWSLKCGRMQFSAGSLHRTV